MRRSEKRAMVWMDTGKFAKAETPTDQKVPGSTRSAGLDWKRSCLPVAKWMKCPWPEGGTLALCVGVGLLWKNDFTL